MAARPPSLLDGPPLLHPMTDEKRKDTIVALLVERRNLYAAGNTSRVNQIDDELRRLGAEAAIPKDRATKRRVADLGQNVTVR